MKTFEFWREPESWEGLGGRTARRYGRWLLRPARSERDRGAVLADVRLLAERVGWMEAHRDMFDLHDLLRA